MKLLKETFENRPVDRESCKRTKLRRIRGVIKSWDGRLAYLPRRWGI